jgi:hypothetical protein
MAWLMSDEQRVINTITINTVANYLYITSEKDKKADDYETAMIKNRTFRKLQKNQLAVTNATFHMACWHMLSCRLHMAGLVVKEKVGFKFT